jgi:Prenyltransferase and squalene oxidase repeat
MSDHKDPTLTIEVAKPKIGFWQKLGGTSLTIALVIHLILGVFAAFWIFRVIYPPEKKVDFLPPGGGGGERGAETKVNTKKRQQITPTTNVKRVFAEGATSNFAIPDPGDNFGEMSALSSLSSGGPSGGLGGSGSGGGFGAGTGKGSGLGMGAGSGKLFGLIPETMRKRCSKDDRLQRLKENGGTPECDEAVVKALRWIKTKQNPDGSFEGANTVAMTGFALLAYFGHCETPASEEFGDSVTKAIVFLVNHGMKNNGRLATNYTVNSWVYEHAIATYALGEAYTFCKELKLEIPNLADITEKAGQFIIDNQHDNGGWAYAYNTSKAGAHTDLSIVGWQIQALKACSHAGIKYKGMNGAISKGLRYVEALQNSEGAFGYTNPPPPSSETKPTLTGVGMLCFQMWDKGNTSPVTKGARSVLDNLAFDYAKETSNLYQHYYESQAMMQRGGKDWQKYNEVFRDQILKNQNPDGSWKNPGHAGHGATPFYNTCLCTLMMEVYYRFLSTDSKGGNRGRHGGI